MSPCRYVDGRDLVFSIDSPGVKVASQRQKCCTMRDSLSVRQGQNEKENRYMQHPNLGCATSFYQTKPPLTLPEGTLHGFTLASRWLLRDTDRGAPPPPCGAVKMNFDPLWRKSHDLLPAFKTLHDASRQARCVAGDSCTATSWGGRGL